MENDINILFQKDEQNLKTIEELKKQLDNKNAEDRMIPTIESQVGRFEN